jgi:hypothetical protein
MMSNRTVFNIKVVGIFLLMLIDIKFVQNIVKYNLGILIFEGYISSFRISKVGDVINSSSCHMRLIW